MQWALKELPLKTRLFCCTEGWLDGWKIGVSLHLSSNQHAFHIVSIDNLDVDKANVT